MATLAAAPQLWILFLAMFFIQFTSNILQGPWQALIPDLVPESQRGTASSLKAVMDIIALVAGGAVGGFFWAGWIPGVKSAVYASGARAGGRICHLCDDHCDLGA